MTGAFNPRANEALATRNGFVRGRNTGIPCAGGTCSYAIPKAQFEGGKGRGITAGWILREKTFRSPEPVRMMSVAYTGMYAGDAARRLVPVD